MSIMDSSEHGGDDTFTTSNNCLHHLVDRSNLLYYWQNKSLLVQEVKCFKENKADDSDNSKGENPIALV